MKITMGNIHTMSSKSSNINLYSADNLEEKALHVVSLDAKLSMTSPNEFELHAPKFVLAGQTDPSHDIADLGLYLKTLTDLQSSDSVSQAALIASNTTAISALDVREAANHAAQGALLGSETGRATTVETALQQAVDDEKTRAEAAEAGLASDLSTETSARSVADALLSAEISVERQRINDIVAGANVDLDSFLEVVTAYQSADSTILATIGALQVSLSALQAQVDALTL